MPRLLCAFCFFIVASCSGRANAEPTYEDSKAAAAARRGSLAREQGEASDARAFRADVEIALIGEIKRLADHWIGTPWGLGAPQTSTPQEGHINCGTFVGTVLRDAGFVLDVRTLQRQPSQLIIKSFVGASRTKKYSNAAMEKFLASVAKMGPGLFIIGLDFHVGFLLQTDEDLRFIHASYVTGAVIDEAAAEASPIIESKYRVVGKILDDGNIADWLAGRRIDVVGDW